jgi:hypothetical protein
MTNIPPARGADGGTTALGTFGTPPFGGRGYHPSYD